MLKGRNIGPLFIIFAAFLWSLDSLLRRSLYTLPALSIVFYEHAFGTLILFPVLIKNIAELTKLKIQEIFSFVWIAVLGGIFGTFFYTAALAQIKFIPFSVVVLLQQVEPVFAIALAAIILKEKITQRYLFFAFMALVGAYMISFKDLVINFSTGRGTIIAAALALGAAFSWGSSTVFGRHVLYKVNFHTAAALRFLLTSLFCIPALLLFKQFVSIADLSRQQLLTLIAITFSTGMVALLIYYYGLKKVEAKISTICEMFFPLSAIFIDIVAFKTELTVSQLVGAVILLLAIYNVSTPVKEETFNNKPAESKTYLEPKKSKDFTIYEREVT